MRLEPEYIEPDSRHLYLWYLEPREPKCRMPDGITGYGECLSWNVWTRDVLCDELGLL